MASQDVLQVPPRPSDVASPPSSRGRTARSHQISSLSMTTLTTTSQSQYPSGSLLRDTEQAVPQPPPDHLPQTKDYWERANMRRMREWCLLQGILLSIMGSWALYTTIRYFIAYRVYPGGARSAALPLGIASLFSVLFVIALAMSFILPCHVTQRRPLLLSQRISPRHALQFLVSFFLFAPAVVNLALVFVWRHAGSGLGLGGRCHWNLDVVWVGVGGQCVPHAPAWGVWLAAAISRLLLTAIVLVVYSFASRNYHALQWPPSYCPEDVRKLGPVEIFQIAQVDAPSRPSPVLHSFSHRSSELPQRSLSSRMAVISKLSDNPNKEELQEQENAGPDFAGSSTLSGEESNQRSAESGVTPSKSLRCTKSPRDVQAPSSSSRHPTLNSSVEDGDLQGFVEQFHALIDQVSRELEEARISECNSETTRKSPSPLLHHGLDMHTPYMTIDGFGREVPSKEPIAVLGGIVKRMPTIESAGSRELASLRSATPVSGASGAGTGSASVGALSIASSTTSHVAMDWLDDASQSSSRSNSIHRLRRPSELGELVREALRARALDQRRAEEV